MMEDGKKRILITSRSFGKLSDQPLKTLEEAGWEVAFDRDDFDAARFAAEIPDYDAIIIGAHDFPADLMARCPRLKLIAKHGAGLDNIDLPAAKRLGIAVTNTPGTNSGAVADLTFGLLIDCARHITKVARDVRAGIWKSTYGQDVHGKTLGIIGFGAIGKQVARRAFGFDMKVRVFDPVIEGIPEEYTGWCTLFADLQEMLSACDFVTIHVPLTEGTRKMMGAAQFAAMPEGSCFLNMARGGCVDEDALYEALVSGHLSAAACDTVSVEPIPAGHPLLTLDQVTITSHIGMYSYEAINAVSQICADNAAALLKGEPLQFTV